MRVTVISDMQGLQSLRADWNRLSEPLMFQQSAWAEAWWRAFAGATQQLMVLQVSDGNGVQGILPLVTAQTAKLGRSLQFVGAGKACGDYLDLIASPDGLGRVCHALVDFLTGPELGYRWDTLCLEGVRSSFSNVELLAHLLVDCGCGFDRRSIDSAWRLALPDSWDRYLATLSKRTRRTLRALNREYIQNGRAELSVIRDREKVQRTLPLLMEMHEHRRKQLGSSGSYSVVGFQVFIEELSRLCGDQSLELRVLRLDGKPVAANLGVVMDRCFYIYQCGFDPRASRCKPGWILNAKVIQEGLGGAFDVVDWLRGDERYKQSLGASPTYLERLELAAPTSAAMLRRSVRMTGSTLKNWWKA